MLAEISGPHSGSERVEYGGITKREKSERRKTTHISNDEHNVIEIIAKENRIIFFYCCCEVLICALWNSVNSNGGQNELK